MNLIKNNDNDTCRTFFDYISYDTRSDEETNTTPSTPGQMVFVKHLKEELEKMGLEEITLDDNGYLMASLPSNTDKTVPTVGFIAHGGHGS